MSNQTIQTSIAPTGTTVGVPVKLTSNDPYARWQEANVVRGVAKGTVSAYAFARLGDITSEQFRGLADDADRLLVGAVGEVEALQLVIGRRQPEPGLGIARMRLDGAAEIALGEAVIAGAI